ncbi:MAG: hypothetical protein WBW33_25735, partial [Bryobacteraceae bacterium]
MARIGAVVASVYRRIRLRTLTQNVTLTPFYPPLEDASPPIPSVPIRPLSGQVQGSHSFHVFRRGAGTQLLEAPTATFSVELILEVIEKLLVAKGPARICAAADQTELV